MRAGEGDTLDCTIEEILMLANRIRVAAALLAAIGGAFAADTSIKKYALPERGSFQMNVPAGWADQLRQPPQALPPTVSFRAGQGKPFEILVTPIWRMRTDVPASTKDTIRQ